MRLLFFSLVISFIFVSITKGQPRLHRNIGLVTAPKILDRICPVPQNLSASGRTGPDYQDTAYDFTLYDREENPLNLSAILQQKKPVLLICGSYTCPFFRSKIPLINTLMGSYGDKLNIFVVYNFEAHPLDDPPYQTDNENANNENASEGIQYYQPKVYGERKAIAEDMQKAIMIKFPIIFDGPCNEWSNFYGPAPNNAYLINIDGVIASKHEWFDRFPNDIIRDIENLLKENGISGSSGDSGAFSVHLENAGTVIDAPGSTIKIVGKIVNESDDDAVVKIKRLHSDLPFGWKTSLCTNVCFNTTVDSTSVRVLAHSLQEIKIYFYTTSKTGQGNVTLNFSNSNVPENEVTMDFHGVTTQNLDAPAEKKKRPASIVLYPSPVHNTLQLRTRLLYSLVRIINGTGMIVLEDAHARYHDLSRLTNGIYFIQLFSENGQLIGTSRFLKE